MDWPRLPADGRRLRRAGAVSLWPLPDRRSADSLPSWPVQQVEFGKPNKTLDRVARVVGLPATDNRAQQKDQQPRGLARDVGQVAGVSRSERFGRCLDLRQLLRSERAMAAAQGKQADRGRLAILAGHAEHDRVHRFARPGLRRRRIQPLYQQPVHQFRRPGDRALRSGVR